MEPNALQALLGHLPYGFQTANLTRQFQADLTLPDGGGFYLVTYGPDGRPVRQAVELEPFIPEDQSCELGYHVVYLLGQLMYFGRVELTHDQRFMQMRDVHYLMPGATGSREVNLLRAGRELHAPCGEMSVNVAYVISWQPLRDDGPVVQAILAGRAKEGV